MIQRALISVSDKSGIIELATWLHKNNVEIISTGGTARKLISADIPVTKIETITKSPELFDGRMKTISFQIGSGLLFDRNNQKHQQEAKEHNISAIDLVVCNLYPFEEVAKKTNDEDELIENIDIGGPTMIRAAAKNYKSVTVLTNPSQYKFLNTINPSADFNRKMALEAFRKCSFYDQTIFSKLSEKIELRYGENPHQSAHVVSTNDKNSILNGVKLQGKTFSYNNYLDMDASWNLISELNSIDEEQTSFCIFKHVNPCGVASSKNSEKALSLAWGGDSISAFGSIIATNKELDEECAKFLSEKFVEVILAPSFSDNAKSILSKKKNLRLYALDLFKDFDDFEVKSISGANLIQKRDFSYSNEVSLKTKKSFSFNSVEFEKFSTMTTKYLKSNAIGFFSKTTQNDFWMTGSGVGQPNRIDSFKLASRKYHKLKKNNNSEYFEDTLMVSDAFFPFDDIVKLSSQEGITNIIQPGGSIKDGVVIGTSDDQGIAMKFTGYRHFKH